MQKISQLENFHKVHPLSNHRSITNHVHNSHRIVKQVIYYYSEVHYFGLNFNVLFLIQNMIMLVFCIKILFMVFLYSKLLLLVEFVLLLGILLLSINGISLFRGNCYRVIFRIMWRRLEGVERD